MSRYAETRINRSKTGALAVLIAVLTALILLLAPNTARAEEASDANVNIVAANVSYDGDIRIVLLAEATLPEGESRAAVKMLFWSGAREEYTLATADLKVGATNSYGTSIKVGDEQYDNALIFESGAIAPEKFGDNVYARAVIECDDGELIYSETEKIGVLDYVYLRYRDKEVGGNVTEEQMAKYRELLDFGARAQVEKSYRTDRLVNSYGTRIQLRDAVMADGFNYGTFLLGDVVSALPRIAAYESELAFWTDSSGNTVSSSRCLDLTVTEQISGEMYTPVYNTASTFDEVTAGDLEVGAENSVTSNGLSFYLANSSDSFGAQIVKEDGNTYLKLADGNDDFGGSVTAIARGDGDFLVLGLDFCVAEFDGGTPLQLQLGGYMLQFGAVETAALKISDVGGATGYLDRYVRPGEWHTLRLAVSSSATDTESARAYLFLDGECVAKSLNVPVGADLDRLLIYGLSASTITAYFDNIELYRTDIPEAEEQGIKPARIFETVTSSSNDRFQNAEMLLDADALAALKAMDAQLFSENIYLWIANLYDPETSALYFSISGRDSYGYLPDIETVAQGYGVLSTLGLGGNTAVLNAEQKANLTAWIQTLQSNRDGYYYHPHWGVSIGNSRLSRDLGNSSSSYSASGNLAYRLFDDANYRLSGGTTGSMGTTTPSTYDNNLTGQLRRSVASAVSKVILASENHNSSMPVHLRSEENLVTYVNSQWNSSCKVAGTHERHFCTDECVVVTDPSDSYMRIDDGELVITRGYRCTSCHVCAHSSGHSYSFGHHFTSMGSQVKAARLGDPLVEYFRDIQENVQASLRDKAQAAYIAENGQAAWNALSSEEQTAIRKAAENGIWEEEVTYGTISGLLKISGIPSTHGYEFLYAEAAIKSALECALFSVENFVSTGQAIVSIYNPFNAMNGIMNNINNYGTDKEVRLRAREIIRERAEELIINTMGKLEGYLMPDGGYSYNYSGYCTHSQGQPVAIAGSREGDVNGTALALGTRSALLSCLGISVSAPFGGVDAYIDGGFDLNADGDTLDEFDLDGDGVADAFEAECTHNMRFRYIITTKGEIEKIDTTTQKYTQTFDEGTIIPGSGTVIKEGNNNALKMVDDDGNTGRSVTFHSANVVDGEHYSRITFDMKILSCNNTTSHQLFIDSGVLRIDFKYKNGYFTFSNVINGKATDLKNTNGKYLEIYANDWFTFDVALYQSGIVKNGKTYYGIITITQNSHVQECYLSSIGSTVSIPSAYRMYSLNGSVNETLYDNVTAYNSIEPGVKDGEYHFDTLAQKIADENILVKSPTFDHDTVYLLADNTAEFDAYDYGGSTVIYNFNGAEAQMLLSEAEVGDRFDIVLLDGEGRAITGVYMIVTAENEIAVFAANGQMLIERIPRDEIYSDGSTARVSRERDMVLSANLDQWILIKIEYHYDMLNPQLDVVIKYSDLTKNGYKTTTAATLTGVDVLEMGANPYDFSTYKVFADGTVYLDDMYLRNVLAGCSGEHDYIEKISSATVKGVDSHGHREYYLSCKNCGARSNETFLVHTYDRVISDEFKLHDATVDSAAVYSESCKLCGTLSGKTFLYGLALEDPTKYNFSGADGSEADIPGYVSVNTGKGKTATVMREAVADAVNYFLRIAKTKGEGSHSLTFKYARASGEALADKYIYEFSFRWGYAKDMMDNRNVILVKMGAGGSLECPASYVAGSDGKTVTYGGVNMYSGEWHSMKYLFVRNDTDDGWKGTAFCDGKSIYSFTVQGNGVPYVDYETRWNLTEGGVKKYTDLELDIDRLKATAVAEKGHSWVEKVTMHALISSASCQSGAIYAKTCDWCGEVAESETFVYGDITDHAMANMFSEELKLCDADCEIAETYYRSCKVCGITNGETFTLGTALGHDDRLVIDKVATRTESALAHYECNRCERSTESASYGEPLCYVFDENSKLPSTVSIIGFRSEPLTTGVWACVLSEQVNGAVNYYLNVQKYGATPTHSLTFRSGETGKTSYVYEFDFRWHYADRMRGYGPIIVKLRLDGSQKAANTMGASEDGSQVRYGTDKHGSVILKSGEWHTIRYEFTRTSDGKGWSYVVKVDGSTIESGSFAGNGVPDVLYETRYGETKKVDKDGDGIAETDEIVNCTDISFDIDNVYCEAK